MGDVKASIEQISRHYKNFDPHWNLKPLEKRLVATLLSCGYTADQLCDAITGLYLDPWHNGKNKEGRKWLSFSYAMRENMVDKYIKSAQSAREQEVRDRNKRRRIQQKDAENMRTAEDMRRMTESGYNVKTVYASHMAGIGKDN